MPYTEEHFERMKSDPLLTRQYLWQCFARWKSSGMDVNDCFQWLDDQDDRRLLDIANIAR